MEEEEAAAVVFWVEAVEGCEGYGEGWVGEEC